MFGRVLALMDGLYGKDYVEGGGQFSLLSLIFRE